LEQIAAYCLFFLSPTITRARERGCQQALFAPPNTSRFFPIHQCDITVSPVFDFHRFLTSTNCCLLVVTIRRPLVRSSAVPCVTPKSLTCYVPMSASVSSDSDDDHQQPSSTKRKRGAGRPPDLMGRSASCSVFGPVSSSAS
jgi:hypothetical protein